MSSARCSQSAIVGDGASGQKLIMVRVRNRILDHALNSANVSVDVKTRTMTVRLNSCEAQKRQLNRYEDSARPASFSLTPNYTRLGIAGARQTWSSYTDIKTFTLGDCIIVKALILETTRGYCPEPLRPRFLPSVLPDAQLTVLPGQFPLQSFPVCIL